MARKATFSERMGLVAPRTAFQTNSIDDDLKIRLWNILDAQLAVDLVREQFVLGLWREVLNRPVDLLNRDTYWLEFREVFFKRAPWNKVYEVIEYAAEQYVGTQTFDEALELGGAGYRFVDGELIPITNETEIEEIEAARAVTRTSGLYSVRTHLEQALTLFADRRKPDYRNSIKESISAVEALVQAILGTSGTLGALIKRINDKLAEPIHPAMVSAIDKLYGYTSDAGGIRHALIDQAPGEEEARFMLVTVSAVVTLLVAKASKAKLAFK